MWPSSNKFGSSHRLQIVHSTQGPTRGARAQQNEPTDVLLSNGSIASDPSIAPEPAAPSYYLLSDALPPLLHQLLTCAHTACLLEARSTHVEFGQGAQVAHVHYILSLHTFLAGITHPSCIALPPVHPLPQPKLHGPSTCRLRLAWRNASRTALRITVAACLLTIGSRRDTSKAARSLAAALRRAACPSRRATILRSPSGQLPGFTPNEHLNVKHLY